MPPHAVVCHPPLTIPPSYPHTRLISSYSIFSSPITHFFLSTNQSYNHQSKFLQSTLTIQSITSTLRSRYSARMDQNVNVAKKKSIGRSSTRKKEGAKVHRKIHKAEREKLKRDRMNELFIELSKALEPAIENVGKSCVLTDTIRILRDLIAQVDLLKKENSTLLAESQYVAIEKNELKEENNAIEAQIKKLKNQIWRPDPSSYLHHNPVALQPVVDNATKAAAPVVGPVFVVPLQTVPGVLETVAKQIGPNVSKPHARYPSPSDSWPFSILTEQSRAD